MSHRAVCICCVSASADALTSAPLCAICFAVSPDGIELVLRTNLFTCVRFSFRYLHFVIINKICFCCSADK